MCGIVGVVLNNVKYNLQDSYLKLFKQLLYVDALRGEHGTGVVKVSQPNFTKQLYKNEVEIIKGALPAADFLSQKEVDTQLSSKNILALIGHNRHATKGAHVYDNTHPFNYGDISLVHNGTLSLFSDHNLVPKEVKLDVDSQEIAYGLHLINSEADDYENQVKTFLEKIEGAYALVWYNSTLQTINFARNDERPLYCGTSEDGAFAFASEGNMLAFLAARNKIKFTEIKQIPVGSWVSFEVSMYYSGVEKSVPFTPKKTSFYEYNWYNPRKYSQSFYKKEVPKLEKKKELSVGDKVKGFLGQLTQTGKFYKVTLIDTESKGYAYVSIDEIERFTSLSMEFYITEIKFNQQLPLTIMLSLVNQENCELCREKTSGDYVLNKVILCEKCYASCY